MTDPKFWADLNRFATLDSTPERFFDELTRFAARACDAPFARTTLITEDGQRFDCASGFPLDDSIPPDLEVCADILLRTPRDLALGNLRVFDRVARTLTPLQQDALQLLALQMVQQLELRRVADDLRRRSLQLARTQATAHIGGWELELATDRLTWTEETYRIHEVSTADFTPTLAAALNFFTPENGVIVNAAMQAAAQLGTPFDMELEMITQAGRQRWVRTIGLREYFDGKPRRVFGVFQDITERRQLEGEILLIAQREQNRIGFDLHDGLGQELTGISLLVHNVTTRLPEALATLRAELVHVEKLVRDAIGTCRLLAHGLSPVSQDRGGLKYALQTLATQIDHLHGIQIGVTLRGAEPSVPESVADHLYRIAQEAITNAIRHAEPRQIAVAMDVSATRVRLTVSDDGSGIESTAGHDGMGLRIMRYRARLIGAAISIERRPEGGTRVVCHLTNHPSAEPAAVPLRVNPRGAKPSGMQ